MNTGPRAIAVCVDDFGLHAGINQAVMELAGLKRISTVSCMVGAPAWTEGAAALRTLPATQVEAGLHFDLTDSPLDSAMRAPLARWLLRGAIGRGDRRALADELQRQLDRFEDGMHRVPSHLDGHQHVHQLAVVRDVVMSVLERRYPTRRPWLRSALPAGAGLKSRVIGWLGSAALARQARERGWALNGRLLGVYDFRGAAPRYEALLRGWIGEARAGDLLICHPATHAPPGDPIGHARTVEYEVLCGPALPQALETAALEVAPLSATFNRRRNQE